MLIVNRSSFAKGAVLGAGFVAVLVALFSPIFGEGRNAFHASDDLFNSIAKGSTNYVPALLEEAEEHRGQVIDAKLEMEEGAERGDVVTVLRSAGIKVLEHPGEVRVMGDLGTLTERALEDAGSMFDRDGAAVEARRGLEGRRALYAWWLALRELERALTGQQQFEQAAFVEEVRARGVEVGYNFYEVEAESARSKAGILTLSLLFYVVYTLWWGFAIYYMVEGVGLQLRAGRKKEV